MSIFSLTWSLSKHDKPHSYDTNKGMCCLLWRPSQSPNGRKRVTVPLSCCAILPASTAFFLASIHFSKRTFSFTPLLLVLHLVTSDWRQSKTANLPKVSRNYVAMEWTRLADQHGTRPEKKEKKTHPFFSQTSESVMVKLLLCED